MAEWWAFWGWPPLAAMTGDRMTVTAAGSAVVLAELADELNWLTSLWELADGLFGEDKWKRPIYEYNCD